MEQRLAKAAEWGHLEEVKTFLCDNPSLDINWKDKFQRTALHSAAFGGNSEIVQLFLAHPDIHVNVQATLGHTPFSLASMKGHISVVRLLLKDPRVDVTLTNADGHTPLWYASFEGNWEVVEWLIASGRNLGALTKKGAFAGKRYTTLDIARKRNKDHVVAVLERFTANPGQTRNELRMKLGLRDDLAAELFSATIFLCDGLLHLKPANTATAPISRFFVIAKKLPMELQMILCNYAFGVLKQNIRQQHAEAAFKSLAMTLLLSRPK